MIVYNIINVGVLLISISLIAYTLYIYTWGTLKHLTYTCTMISVPLALKLCNFKLIGLCQNKVKVGGKKNY